MQDLEEEYNKAIFDTDKGRVDAAIELALVRGLSPEDVVFGIIVPSLDSMMTKLAEKGEVNLAQHFFASQMAADLTERLLGRFSSASEIRATVVIGTSRGDFHGLGKRIVSGCLRAHRMNVIDLGLNVLPERFVDEAQLHKADVIAISSMMYHTATGEDGCLKVRQILRERQLESKVKIIVGGAPYRFDHKLYQTVQADSWGENGNMAGAIVSELMTKAQKW